MPTTCAVSNFSIPTAIKRLTTDGGQGRGISITWSTGEDVELSSVTLRKNCPCAECLEKRGDTSHSKPLIGRAASLRVLSATAEEETDLRKVWPIGNYAVGIQWGDRHDSGIYSYELLRELSNSKQER